MGCGFPRYFCLIVKSLPFHRGMKLRLKGVYQFRAGVTSLWFNVMTSGGPSSTPLLMWNPMLDMVCYLSMLMFCVVAPYAAPAA